MQFFILFGNGKGAYHIQVHRRDAGHIHRRYTVCQEAAERIRTNEIIYTIRTYQYTHENLFQANLVRVESRILGAPTSQNPRPRMNPRTCPCHYTRSSFLLISALRFALYLSALSRARAYTPPRPTEQFPPSVVVMSCTCSCRVQLVSPCEQGAASHPIADLFLIIHCPGPGPGPVA